MRRVIATSSITNQSPQPLERAPNKRELILSQIRDKVNAGKLYCPPLKRHEVRTNNPFYNGAFLGGTTA
jgi:hypothetical protein